MGVDKGYTQNYAFDIRYSPEPASPTSTSNLPAQDKKSTAKKPLPQTPVNPSIPTSPSSAAAASSAFHRSNPFSPSSQSASLLDTPNPPLRSSQRGSTPRVDVSRVPSAGNATRAQSSYRTTAPSDHSNGPSGRPRSLSARAPKLAVDVSTTPQRSVSHKYTHKRNSSLPKRFPGDMSHRPLDMIKRETKVANRAGKHRRGPSQPDIIDALDTVGGGYHHDGPYEATLASRNIHSKYSPLEAVRDSNMEAIRATPHEYIQDSLTRHVPLQGTSTIPNGSVDLKGNVLTYQEGADLMREKDAPGGAYGRWDGTAYHPDDLKGKGEPWFTYERDYKRKVRERLLHPDQQPDDIELQSRGASHHRSLSNGAYDATSTGLSSRAGNSVQRSNTTGRRVSDGLKRRFGRKKDMPAEQVH